MGSGIWSNDVYSAAEEYRRRTGASAFQHNDRGATTVHPDLNPFKLKARESRDSDEHPESVPIAVLFDVTGSMRHVPRVLQTRLPELIGLLQRREYVKHPQIMFGAVGDAFCDRAPLQVGQFESDNRMDDDLGRILLEGGGGGGMRESYELAMYFMARHTARMYDLYFIIPAAAHHAGDDRLLRFWRGLLGQNVIQLDDLDAICETIAVTIGLAEGVVDLGEGLEHLRQHRSTSTGSVARALSALGGGGIVRL